MLFVESMSETASIEVSFELQWLRHRMCCMLCCFSTLSWIVEEAQDKLLKVSNYFYRDYLLYHRCVSDLLTRYDVFEPVYRCINNNKLFNRS